MKSKSTALNLGFLLIALLVLAGTLIDTIWLNYPVKPLIMVWLAIMFLSLTKPQPYRWLVVLAFFFSWAGDVLLMLAHENEMLFFAGVGGFFLSQLTYVFVFRKFAITNGKGLIARNPLWILPFAAYFIIIFLILYPNLEGIMKPVVALYALSLVSMSVMALNRSGLTPKPALVLLFSGSIFFLLSDSLLAINKFATELPQSGFLVLSTYTLAQYLILQGLIKSTEK
jgi:uncharacterized membrane protein YhhN